MRVIAGLAKGRRLKTGRDWAVRPTADRVKESLFNVLAARVAGAEFLDLFAGAGGVGIEALSRGASRVVFVDHHPQSLRWVADNLAAVGLAPRGELQRQDAAAALLALAHRGDRFDLVFLDPPYRHGLVAPVLQRLGELDLLRPGAVVVAEHDRREDCPSLCGRLERFRQLRFGDTILSLYRQREEGRVGEGNLSGQL